MLYHDSFRLCNMHLKIRMNFQASCHMITKEFLSEGSKDRSSLHRFGSRRRCFAGAALDAPRPPETACCRRAAGRPLAAPRSVRPETEVPTRTAPFFWDRPLVREGGAVWARGKLRGTGPRAVERARALATFSLNRTTLPHPGRGLALGSSAAGLGMGEVATGSPVKHGTTPLSQEAWISGFGAPRE